MIKVVLLGEIGRVFGEEFDFNIKTCKEAYQALKANLLGFEKFLIDSDKKGKHYRIMADDKEIHDEAEFANLPANTTIYILPVILGAGSFLGALLGVAIAAVGFFTGIPFLVKIGLSIAVSGLVSLFAETPKQPTATQRVSAGASSYFFGGRTNTAQQGNVVPLGYGRLKLGTYIIHSAVKNQDVPDANSNIPE